MGRMDAELNRIPMTWSGPDVCREEEERKGKAREGAASSGGGEKKRVQTFASVCLAPAYMDLTIHRSQREVTHGGLEVF